MPKLHEARGPGRPGSCALRPQCFHHKSRNAFGTLGKRLGHLNAVGTLETRQAHLERGRGTFFAFVFCNYNFFAITMFLQLQFFLQLQCFCDCMKGCQ